MFDRCIRTLSLALVAGVLLNTGCASTGKGASRESTMTRERMYRILHETFVRVDYDDDSLQSILNEMEEISGLDIVAHWAEEFGEGLQPDAEIDLHFEEPIRLVAALELALGRSVESGVETTWQLGQTWIEVGTKDSLNDSRYIIVYPIDELLAVSPVFHGMPEADRARFVNWFERGMAGMDESFRIDVPETGEAKMWEEFDEYAVAAEIEDIIVSLVDTFQWEQNGGEGGAIRYFNGAFIVNAADYLHRQLGGYHFVGSEALFMRRPFEPPVEDGGP